MEKTFDSGPMNRKTLLVGGVSLAGAAFLGVSEADASGDDEWASGTIASEISDDAVDVTLLTTSDPVQVDLVKGAIINADLTPGATVLIEGSEREDGSIAAQRIVRGVFGVRSDVER
jgi:hypothetical protein